MQVETSIEAAVLGWAATRAEGGTRGRAGLSLIEVLAADLGLDPNPATLDELAATLAALERQERIVLDGPVAVATDLAPLDLAGAAPRDSGSSEAILSPRIAAYSLLAEAPWHVQLNWVLRALRDQTDPLTGIGGLDFRQTIAELELNPKDVRHALETLGLLHKAAGDGATGAESWWVDPEATVTAEALLELQEMERAMEQPDSPPPSEPPAVTPRALPADLGPLMDSLAKLEPRLVELLHQMVEAAESLHAMAGTQAQLLGDQTQEIEALRHDRERLLRDASDLRQEMWTLKRSSTRGEAAESLTAEAAKLRAAEHRFASTASEVTDKVRRVQRGLDELSATED